MTQKTPDDVLDEYVQKLGESRGRYFRAVETDLYTLRMHFSIYAALFGTNEERVLLLNSVSGNTSYWIERSMFECIILQVCRLTDPWEAARGKRNVTIRRLPILLSEPDAELDRRVDNAKNSTKFARDWRNRYIAHADEEVRLGAATLDRATRQSVRHAIDSIAACIRRFALSEMGVTLNTHPIRSLDHDEIEFLTALYLGRNALDKRERDRKEIISKRDWKKLDGLEKLPGWLTIRDNQEHDIE